MADKKRKPFGDWRDEFFEDFFEEFGFDFDKFSDRMMRMWDKMLKDPDIKTFGPYVYGFTYKVGPNGRPIFREFGNVPGVRTVGAPESMEKDVREPITDLTEDKDKIYVTYELPGVSKENIDVKVSDYNVTINVREEKRKYYKSIDFDYKLKPESSSAKFVNGMLDLTVEREKEEEKKGRTVKIE